MKTVEQIAQEIVAREGGYVNDPDDPGGATKWGVTLGTLQALGVDLNHDGVVSAADVKLLSRAQAVQIFIRHYYERPQIQLLPEAVQASVFDMQVNAGANAVRILQKLLNETGHTVSVDGAIGPQTAAAAHQAAAPDPPLFADAYGIAQRNYYYDLAARRPKSRKYATTKQGQKGGWIRRAEEFISPRFHLSEAEHRAKVAAWG
ncbi:putative peptidoglycan binding protein [Rhodobacter aestuarii]|uniref:Predicted Peptidoglycan domain-containing protein n=1 Tax=Rhodobacter aestuarii TaxID=453582 RepID=A0A1N7NFR2_9RHOB|nr:holin-associated N-acetylmuramidase [Rhodobacter aestuarii]PTV96438.1 putative peptidoglycan binding protein [Rhodobacter aestuarii]SIS97160.1 Predicted Peptidoglycan domain-containing protein [Rhodobacter aestuarii]